MSAPAPPAPKPGSKSATHVLFSKSNRYRTHSAPTQHATWRRCGARLMPRHARAPERAATALPPRAHRAPPSSKLPAPRRGLVSRPRAALPPRPATQRTAHTEAASAGLQHSCCSLTAGPAAMHTTVFFTPVFAFPPPPDTMMYGSRCPARDVATPRPNTGHGSRSDVLEAMTATAGNAITDS